MIRVGLVINPRSQRNRQSMPAIRKILRSRPDVLHAEAAGVGDLTDILAEFARREVGLIAISGGDGTVQAVMTRLLNDGPFSSIPPLALLPSGMTNVIAADVGVGGRPGSSLARLLDSVARKEERTFERPSRFVLSVQRTPDEAPIHGMFLGTAAFHRAAMLAHEKVYTRGPRHRFGAAVTLAAALFEALAGRSRRNGILRGDRIAIALDGNPVAEQDYALFLATTLERLILGWMPFWGQGCGELRYTSIRYPPAGLARAIWPVLRGKSRPWMERDGYLSGRARECTLTLSCPIVLDGEFLVPEPGIPVTIRSDREIEFWRM